MVDMDARQKLKEFCGEVVRAELQKGRLKRPRSLRNLKRWITKHVARTAGIRGARLKKRWARAAMSALLASGMFFLSGTEGRAAVSFIAPETNPFDGVFVGYTAAPVFADIDGDGDLDVFVGEYYGSIKYYVNNGNGTFSEQTGPWNSVTKAGNPFNGIDVGNRAAPVFADLDGDGDLDAFIGERFGMIEYYANNGTGVFTRQTGPWNPVTKAGNPFYAVDMGSRAIPRFADIDGDGDLDAFIGVDDGTIKYYVNNGSGVFTAQTGAWNPVTKAGNPFNGVDVGINSAPAFADIDGDGDLDAFIGEFYGTVKYYVNNGSGVFTAQTGVWNSTTKAGNPLNGADAGYYSVPAFADIDGDGDLDVFIGEYFGSIKYYVNNGRGVFGQAGAVVVNPMTGVDVGSWSAPAFADIDGDGDLDAFIGEGTGTIKYYVNVGNNVLTEQTGVWNPITKSGNPFHGVDIGILSVPAFADIDGDGDLDAFIGEGYGSIKYFVNNGSGVFTEQTGAWNPDTKTGNPFNGIDAGTRVIPFFADIDGDGDLDAFIGNYEGTIKYYVNNGSGVLTEQTGPWNSAAKTGNPLNGVAVIYSAPSFEDIDGDGDLDAFIGNGDGIIKYYVNNGSGVFAEQTGAWNPDTKAGNPFYDVDAGNVSVPSFVDIDGDGDLDAFIGERFGAIRYYENNDGYFAAPTALTVVNPLEGFDVGYYSVPVFADIDGDGDLDSFVGSIWGTINYYVNNGSGVFTEQTGPWNPGTKAGNPFNGINVGNFSVPAFEDIDGDGDLDAFFGANDGTINYYVNNGSGVFTEQTGTWNSSAKTGNPFDGVNVGGNSALFFADIDSDGDRDAFIGANDGTIRYFVNDGGGVFTEQTGPWNPAPKSGNPLAGIDVGILSRPVFADIDGDGDLDAIIGSYEGSIKYYTNNGSGGFTEQTGVWDAYGETGNPFYGINVGAGSAPVFADIDGDGDPDAFIGAQNGKIYFYKNMNNKPVHISLDDADVNRSSGVNALVGNLSGTDPDTFDTLTFSLAPGGTHNSLFNTSGASLRANNAESMAAGNYSVVVSAGDGNNGTVTRAFTVTVINDCTYDASPTLAAFGHSGGSGTIDVSANGCSWSVINNVPSWVNITSGSSGSGNGTVAYSVSRNWSTQPRQGTLEVAGKTVTITETGTSCTYTLSSSSSPAFTAAGGSAGVDITTQNGCYWEASSGNGWIAVDIASGTGSYALLYSASENIGAARTGTISISGQALTVNQAGMESWPCPSLNAVSYGSSFDYTIQSAYDKAATSESIKLLPVDYVELLEFDRAISVTLNGGYDCDFQNNNSVSKINGTITISAGTITLNKIILK